MAIGKSGFGKKEGLKLSIEMSPMIDCVFQLLIFFIVTLQMDPSLDDIMQLPDAYKSARQEELNMEIYLLPAGMVATKEGLYVEEGWLNEDGSLNSEEGSDYSGQIAFASKGDFDSMFVHIDDVPYLIDIEREKKSKELIRHQNIQRKKLGKLPYTEAQRDSIKNNMALLIKAHKDVFYGRVLQVVEKAKDAGVTTFAFVTNVESSQLMDKGKRIVQ